MEGQTMRAILTEGILHRRYRKAASQQRQPFLWRFGWARQEAELQGRPCSEGAWRQLGDTTRQMVVQALDSGPRDCPRERSRRASAARITPVEISAVSVKDYLGEVVAHLRFPRHHPKARSRSAQSPQKRPHRHDRARFATPLNIAAFGHPKHRECSAN
jgi:hypothetical protein